MAGVNHHDDVALGVRPVDQRPGCGRYRVRHLGGAGEIKHQAVPLPIWGGNKKLVSCIGVAGPARSRVSALPKCPERIEVIPLFFRPTGEVATEPGAAQVDDQAFRRGQEKVL